MPQIKIPATYMRGGTSKGVFFKLTDLPQSAQTAGATRDQLLLRVIGSPDPYGKQIDGMGGATSSTSKAVIVSKSTQADHDIDYLFGQIAIDQALVDWSGNCGNLSAAVGSFAIDSGLIDAASLPDNGIATVKIWQANISKTIIAKIPMSDGQVQETGDFELDGVTFSAAEVQIEFIHPAAQGALFPTGNLVDELNIPELGSFNVTMINAGIPTLFLNAHELGYSGSELQDDLNNDLPKLQMLESLRAHGAVKMGLIEHPEQAIKRQHTPKIAFVAPPSGYLTSSGKNIHATDIDLLVRALSMGQLHHAMMGTAAVAISIAAAIPNTLVNQAAGGGERDSVVFGHPSGTLKVGGKASLVNGQWQAEKAIMSRSARILMQGAVRIPSDCL